MNAFAVQVLATAVGDPARFRPPDLPAPGLDDMARDGEGFPLDWHARQEHRHARNDFMYAMEQERPGEWVALVQKYDREEPAHYVAWKRLRDAPEPAT